jgi:hypothetical protein
MSEARRQRKAFVKISKEWSPWSQVEVTDDLRRQHPHLQHCKMIYNNSRYECQLFPCTSPIGGIQQVVVHRHVGQEEIPWSDLQRIKHELFGHNSVALEMYPPMDCEWNVSANIRVLWIMPQNWIPPMGLHREEAWGR